MINTGPVHYHTLPPQNDDLKNKDSSSSMLMNYGMLMISLQIPMVYIILDSLTGVYDLLFNALLNG